ncbi:hypothetical protein [Hymenobacter cellulosivorans]|uniref:DUF3471 domain-containing protein n=1 Tax=Hymenobacter cellulosivorans TaxID=2932249 RepID=A0ABY4F3Y1_9BACT|nr:hypothetical protein [Hymenobacter cellulosivorans]UOQ51353.1 hypothetical protein MUN80_16485 [Hymenobacter cellulosivorans]
MRLPQQELSIICLANTQNLYGLTQQLFRLAEHLAPGAFPPAPPVATLPAGPATDLPGIYLEPTSLTNVRIITEQDGLLRAARSNRGYAQPLRATTPDTYVNQGQGETSYAFARAEDGQVRHLRSVERGNAIVLQKTAPAALSQAALHRYTGRYYSAELNQHFRLTQRRGQLRLSLYRLVHVPFVALEGHRFLADLQGHNCVAFQLDPAGKVTGFTFHREAINGLVFQRQR